MRAFWLGATIGACLAIPAAALADGDETAMRIAGRLGYDTRDEAAYAVSKVWPADESKTLVALAFPSKKEEDDDGGDADADSDSGGVYDLDVLIVDSATEAVRARHTAKRAIECDGVRLTGLEIDTAPYRLAKGVRAFGVRRSYYGSHAVNPSESTVLDLFVESGKRLRRVLHSMEVASNGGEWDMQCEGSFREIQRTIRIGKSASRGFQDLLVEGRVRDRTNVRKGEECVSRVKLGPPERFTLKYDGNAYEVPPQLKYE